MKWEHQKNHQSYTTSQGQYQNRSIIEQKCQELLEESYTKTSTKKSHSLQAIHSFQELNQQQCQIQIENQQFKTQNRQSNFNEFSIHVPKIDQANIGSFLQFKEELKIQDFTYLNSFQGQEFISKMNFIIQHWQVYKHQYLKQMKDFLNIANEKVERIKNYQDFYPGLAEMLQKISKKIEHKGNKDLSKCQVSKQDILFQNYINQQQAKANKSGSYYYKQENEERKHLGLYIADKKYFLKNHQTWNLFFFIGAAMKRYNINLSSQKEFQKQCKKNYKFAELLLQNNQLTQPSQLICCSKFFYMNFNVTPVASTSLICRPINSNLKKKVQNLYLQRAKKTGKKVDDKVQADQYNRQMKGLMLDICSLLNNGGGVILLYAKRIYLETWAQGETILQDKKQLYIKLIENSLQAIKPSVKLNKQIFITFVPIVKNPYQYDYQTEVEDEKDRIVNRNYIQGLYVPRIKILPTQTQKVYLYQISNQQPISAIYEKYYRKQIKGKDLSQFKSQKQKYFKIEEQDQQTRQLLTKDYLHQDRHICPQPYKGHQMYMQQQRHLNIEPQKQFKYMSMLVAHKSNYADIQQKLINKGINCKITDTFYNLKLKSSASSAPLYHNIRFDQLLTQVGYNKQFEYNGRYILIVSVTTYIKILNKTNKAAPSQMIPMAQMLTLLEFVQKHFQHNSEVLECYKFITEEGQRQHYVKASTRETNLLIYYLLHHNGQKCIFKNPKSLEKIPYQEKLKRWQLLYSVETKKK